MLTKISRLLLVALILITASLVAQKNSLVSKRYMIDEDGNRMTMRQVAGYPPKVLPPVVQLPKTMKTGEKGAFWLNNVPSYTWCYGCTATAFAIFNGYFDSFGAPGVYTGPANGGVQPMTNGVWATSSQTGTDQCAVAASKEGVDGRATKGHGDDFWTNYGDEATDPYYGAWTEHDIEVGQPSTADFMGTNQWYNWENSDGSTTIWSSSGGVYDYAGSEGSTPAWRDGVHGMRLFYESMGMTVQKNYTRTCTGYDDPDDDPDMGPATGGYEFSMYKASIDAGRPVIIQIEGHSMVGFGYDDTATPETLYLRDTWDTNTSDTAHSMLWMGEYSNMQHYAISEVVLGTEEYWAAPEGMFALNDNREVTITWDDPSKGSKNVTYKISRDGSQIGTSATELYIDNGASDGVHNYTVIAVYVDDAVDSYPSLPATVYVSISVTEFHDDFESGDGQWLLYDGWGLCQEYHNGGLNSLSESPNADYVDGTDQLPAGGSVGEVAPGLNFTTAADIELAFDFRYDIELSFDYMYLQTCKDGINWVTMRVWDGEGVGWYREVISLGVFAGESNVRLRFLWVSDPGYTVEGSNIDNFDITPSSTDSAPPFVFYSKVKDYYSAYPDGFEISCDITDFTGVASADILYKLNGSGEVTADAPTVAGDTYSWVLPSFDPGDLVEFRFDCVDAAAGSNQGYTGPFYYRDGLQQKYDEASVSFYTEIVTGTAQYDYHAYAVKFSSFHDDVVGAIVRGYDDVSQPEDNSDMMINVWADLAGAPGAALITPLAFTNPATLAETNAWGYVDLSAYPAIDDIAGDYYIGYECATGQTDVTRTTMTDTGTEFTFDYGRAWMQMYESNGADLNWSLQNATNHHIRCITTNNGAVPGIISPSPSLMTEVLVPDGTNAQTLNINNIGGYSLDYVASIDYNGTAGSAEVATNNFNTGLVWTSSGDVPWLLSTSYDGGNLDGSQYAYSAATTTGNTAKITYLTSNNYDLSAYGGGTIEFDQKKADGTSTGATGTLQVSNDGAVWTPLYSVGGAVGAWGNPDHQLADIPAEFMTATARFRFMANYPKRTGYWAVDNIVINGFTPYVWMALDGGLTASGTVAAAGTDPITVGFDAAGLAEGSYTANIRLVSDDSNESVFVQLDVSGATIPDPTTLVYPTDALTIPDLTPDFDWATIAAASSYDLLVDNNADFLSPELDENAASSNFTPSANLADGTYYWKVRSRNAAGASAYTSTWTVILSSPNITLSEVAVAGTADVDATDTDAFDIGNTGTYDLDYAMSIDYVVAKGTKADIALLSNDFNSALGWAASGALTWVQSSDTNLDGSLYAQVLSDEVADPNGTQAGTLTTTVFNGTASYAVFVDFDQYAELLTSLCTIEYTTDGSTWIEMYSNAFTIGAMGTPDHQRVQVPEISATMQIRFNGSFKNQTSSSWNIDNVEITGLDPANYGWLVARNIMWETFGTVAPAGSDQIDVTYDATGMDAGTYDANITVTSTDPDEPVKVITVQFVVTGGVVIPAVPANVVTSIVSGDIVFDWDDSADATGYDVYSSDDPYGTFAFVTSVVPSTYTVAADQAKLFYYFVATNATKVADKTTQKLSKDRHKKDDSGK